MGLVDFRCKMASLRATTESQATPRKKRTFDIAFLTGQSENSSEGTTSSSGAVSSIIPKKPISSFPEAARDSSCYESDFSPGGGENGTCNLTLEGTSSSTTSSSIDIMTNGSFVPSDSDSPELSPGIPEISGSKRTKSHKYRQSANNNNRPEIKSFLEEIRSDSKKTIDINQTFSSSSGGMGRNGKDNLGQQQFSGLLPPTHNQGSYHQHPLPVSSYSDFRLPHLGSTFVFLPHMQMAKFPIHFPGSAKGNSAGTDLTNYAKSRSAFPTEQQQQQYLAAATAAAYPYHYSNFMLQEQPTRSLGQDHQHQNHRPPQGSPPHSQHSQSSEGQICTGNGMSSGNNTVATLLPPSLTALSLPAQNVCAKCSIGFRMTSDLVYHMRSHHKRETDPMKKKREDKLKCPVCHETFRERHHLTRHMTAHQDRAEELELERNKMTPV